MTRGVINRGRRPSQGLESYQRGLELLAKNVDRLRHERGLTLEAASAQAGIHFRHLQKVEAEGANATLLTLACIAAAFGVSIADLFREETE